MNTSNQLEYLYGLEYSDIADMPYKVALQLKIDVGYELLSILCEEGEDICRLQDVKKAIKINEYLLNELKN
jgi:hypothetical protein